MTQLFADKHVVITGGTGGLGSAVVSAFLDAGATCHIPMEESSVPERVSWATHGSAHAAPKINLGEPSQVAAFYQGLPSLWASVHLVGGFAMASIADTDEAALQAMWQLNAVTCFSCSRHAIAAMRQSGDGGRIVNVAARPALQPAPGMIAYSVSKAAVAAMTRSMATELVDDRILVNAVVPSMIDTRQNRQAMPDADFDAWPKAEQIADAIRFLASPENQLTSGTLLPVYGRS